MDKRLKKLLREEGHRVKSDGTLKGYTKKELIETIRCLEHNFALSLHVSKRRFLINWELAEKYPAYELATIFRKVDEKMNEAYGE